VSVETARNALIAAGFQPVVGRSIYSRTVQKNWVIYTYPRPGKYAVEGQQVQLIISLGPEAIVPNVTNPLKTENEAIRAIKNADLNYSIVLVTTPGYLPNYVTNQSPGPLTPVSPQQVVTIYVEQAPPTTTTTTTTTSTTTTTTTTPSISGISGIG
jgi:serine/threonine-protein kinase